MRIIFYLLGLILMSIGFTYLIMYLNLLTFGYSLGEYLDFILKKYQCYYVLIGFVIITISIYWKGDKHDIRI